MCLIGTANCNLVVHFIIRMAYRFMINLIGTQHKGVSVVRKLRETSTKNKKKRSLEPDVLYILNTLA